MALVGGLLVALTFTRLTAFDFGCNEFKFEDFLVRKVWGFFYMNYSIHELATE